MTRSIKMTMADVLDARAFHACQGRHGSPVMETSTFKNHAKGEFEFDPENPWAKERENRRACGFKD